MCQIKRGQLWVGKKKEEILKRPKFEGDPNNWEWKESPIPRLTQSFKECGNLALGRNKFLAFFGKRRDPHWKEIIREEMEFWGKEKFLCPKELGLTQGTKGIQKGRNLKEEISQEKGIY